MIRKRQRDFDISEAVQNAAAGYGAVILGLISFILLIMIVMAITRAVVGLSLLTPATNATTEIAPAEIAPPPALPAN